MPDTFVPMAPAMLSGTGNGFTPLQLKPAMQATGHTAPAAIGSPAASNSPAASGAPAAQNCPPPKVTLQRQGEVVSGIRIQCGCGQVIELSCVY